MTSIWRNCGEMTGSPYSLVNIDIKQKHSEIVKNLEMKKYFYKTNKNEDGGNLKK